VSCSRSPFERTGWTLKGSLPAKAWRLPLEESGTARAPARYPGEGGERYYHQTIDAQARRLFHCLIDATDERHFGIDLRDQAIALGWNSMFDSCRACIYRIWLVNNGVNLHIFSQKYLAAALKPSLRPEEEQQRKIARSVQSSQRSTLEHHFPTGCDKIFPLRILSHPVGKN
jgi:hypothetical protein